MKFIIPKMKAEILDLLMLYFFKKGDDEKSIYLQVQLIKLLKS